MIIQRQEFELMENRMTIQGLKDENAALRASLRQITGRSRVNNHQLKHP